MAGMNLHRITSALIRFIGREIRRSTIRHSAGAPRHWGPSNGRRGRRGRQEHPGPAATEQAGPSNSSAAVHHAYQAPPMPAFVAPPMDWAPARLQPRSWARSSSTPPRPRHRRGSYSAMAWMQAWPFVRCTDKALALPAISAPCTGTGRALHRRPLHHRNRRSSMSRSPTRTSQRRRPPTKTRSTSPLQAMALCPP